MHYQNERNYGCRVSDSWTYRGLRTAIIENELLRIVILIDKGADVNAKTVSGLTPLIGAANGGLDLVKILVDSGADVNHEDEYGESPMKSALETEDEEIRLDIKKYLVEKGANEVENSKET